MAHNVIMNLKVKESIEFATQMKIKVNRADDHQTASYQFDHRLNDDDFKNCYEVAGHAIDIIKGTNEQLCDGRSLSATEKFDILRTHWTLVSNSIQVETFKKGK